MRALALMAALWAGAAGAECRQALALGLDVSGSVDAREYRMQLEGLASALDDPEVRAALFALPGAPVDLAVYEWSGPDGQRVILPWTTLSDATALAAALTTITEAARVAGDPSTAIGAAMLFGAAMLDQRPACWRRVLDLSGDGRSNTGPRPQDVRDGCALAGVTVNALVVGSDAPRSAGGGGDDLVDYFRAWVIHGPDAFIQEALGYDDYSRAMKRTLLRELQVMAVSDAQ